MDRYIPEKDGKPATHIILTLEEYNILVRDLRIAQDEIQSTIASANSKIVAYKKKAEELIKQERDNTKRCIEASQRDLKEAQNEIDRLNDLNANMLRIAKERANARRGLKPKKIHNGYLVLDSSQHNYIFRYWMKSKSYTDEFSCWKVRIQSPYDSSIPYGTITKNIYEDLRKVFGGSLGIDSICDVDKVNYDDFRKMWDSGKNIIFKTLYKANIKSGLWEIEYLVKSDINVPEDMRKKYDKNIIKDIDSLELDERLHNKK